MCSVLVQNRMQRAAHPRSFAYWAQPEHLRPSGITGVCRQLRLHIPVGLMQDQQIVRPFADESPTSLFRFLLCLGVSSKNSSHEFSSCSWPTIGQGKLRPFFHHGPEGLEAPITATLYPNAPSSSESSHQPLWVPGVPGGPFGLGLGFWPFVVLSTNLFCSSTIPLMNTLNCSNT